MQDRIIFSGLCLWLTLMLVPALTWGQDEVTHDSDQPVNISSNSLDADDKAGVFIFKGDVVAKQDNATIYSDQLEVYYAQTPEQNNEAGTVDKNNRSILKIVASGAVRIVQNERIATGERAEYVYADSAIILTGSPKVIQGTNTVSGEKITVYLNDERSIVEGGAQKRVNATFVPGDHE
ncbi:MAG: lipopolysaccharide transport periplasmic protein LptA [Desulfuromonadaceae bacterium]|nr:lipopolysaccharide transport periplasmic protein LptA [Desulfuromonadaceae bacterium]